MNQAVELLKHLLPVIRSSFDDYHDYTQTVTLEYENGLVDEIHNPCPTDANALKNGIYESILRNTKLGLSPIKAIVKDYGTIYAGDAGSSGFYVHVCTPEGVTRIK
jgi:hypothetical protein